MEETLCRLIFDLQVLSTVSRHNIQLKLQGNERRKLPKCRTMVSTYIFRYSTKEIICFTRV